MDRVEGEMRWCLERAFELHEQMFEQRADRLRVEICLIALGLAVLSASRET